MISMLYLDMDEGIVKPLGSFVGSPKYSLIVARPSTLALKKLRNTNDVPKTHCR